MRSTRRAAWSRSRIRSTRSAPSHIRAAPLSELAAGGQDRHDRGLQQPRDASAATTSRRPSSRRATASRASRAATATRRFEVAMSFNALPAFDDRGRAAERAGRERVARQPIDRPHPPHDPLGGVEQHRARLARPRDRDGAGARPGAAGAGGEGADRAAGPRRAAGPARTRRHPMTGDSDPPSAQTAGAAPEHPAARTSTATPSTSPASSWTRRPRRRSPSREVSLARRFLNWRTSARSSSAWRSWSSSSGSS